MDPSNPPKKTLLSSEVQPDDTRQNETHPMGIDRRNAGALGPFVSLAAGS